MFEIEAVTAIIPIVVNWCKSSRRGGRVAECGGLLNVARSYRFNPSYNLQMVVSAPRWGEMLSFG